LVAQNTVGPGASPPSRIAAADFAVYTASSSGAPAARMRSNVRAPAGVARP
jgi:hypothetical protein